MGWYTGIGFGPSGEGYFRLTAFGTYEYTCSYGADPDTVRFNGKIKTGRTTFGSVCFSILKQRMIHNGGQETKWNTVNYRLAA